MGSALLAEALALVDLDLVELVLKFGLVYGDVGFYARRNLSLFLLTLCKAGFAVCACKSVEGVVGAPLADLLHGLCHRRAGDRDLLDRHTVARRHRSCRRDGLFSLQDAGLCASRGHILKLVLTAIIMLG
uniref:Putative secreted protein n=1 Tax=Ixodes ricinus TaxID=34613 RepID=A0A6B0URG5_IXORI